MGKGKGICLSGYPERSTGECSRIIELLREEPRGLSTSEISRRLGMNRNSVAKYLNMLVVSGHLEMQEVAVAKVYYLSHRVPISAMLDYSSDLILVLNGAGKVVQLNENFLSFIGMERDDVLGKDVHCLDAPLLSHLREEGLIRDVLNGRKKIRELEFEKDGEIFFFVEKRVLTVFEDGDPGMMILFEDVTAARQAEIELREALKEKEALLANIHQRVRNNLQIISSLLALQASSMGEGMGCEMIRKTEGRIGALARAHDHLDRSPDHAHVDLGDYLADLVEDLAKTASFPAEQIITIFNPPRILLRLDAAIPLGLVVNELVSNAISHAYPEDRPGIVRVEGVVEGGEFTLLVQDEGIGMPEDFDLAASGPLGLNLARNIVEGELGGSMKISDGTGAGVRVTFPLGGEAL
ncbi:PAS domain S-box protein [Methanofollis formosanus]|uniref:PAS domain S-box protein n=1 Tax=Methanofollis formosanus TaxID=299308 RepID=A0A8G1EGX2_9EURY|nr:histidine kinase dimerization/phosphoacceptor domain -containing protein [Methanofollis formosanus]QYZ79367.1 PAS domain S-box protein [Methanofollis formosanus]